MKRLLTALASAVLLSGLPVTAELKMLLPLERTAFQTNEWIDVAVLRSSSEPLKAGELKLTLSGDDGSRAVFTFTVKGAAVEDTVLPPPPLPKGAKKPASAPAPTIIKEARQTESLRLNGYLLRPGHYAVEVACDGTTGKTEFDLFSDVRKSAFRLVHWVGGAKETDLVSHGEEGLGFNMSLGRFYQGPREVASIDGTIRAGMDFMEVDTMGGAHQMDGRLECDWSDPYVMRGGAARGVRQAFSYRTAPNAAGVHFYDEPGLTYIKHPVTGEFGPHGIPSQERSYASAFGVPPQPYQQFNAGDANVVSAWEHWANWKLSFMPAAWKLSGFGVQYVRGDMMSITQSVYGWSAFTDGYYYNVVRSLSLTSGHGGYDDLPLGYFMAGFFSEFGRARDLGRPYWYMPEWFDNTPAGYALEQYLSFMCGLTGMTTPPTADTRRPANVNVMAGIVQSNKVMGRLGTIFTTMPMPRPEVAVLYSLSSNLHQDPRTGSYNNHQFRQLMFTYLAVKSLHVPIQPVVDEDVMDGTLAAHHKAVVIMGVEYLDPRVVTALEAFAAAGRLVVTSDDCKVKIKGATALGMAVDYSWLTQYEQYQKTAGDFDKFLQVSGIGLWIKAAQNTAKALGAVLAKAGIGPVLDCDQNMVVASKVARGDIEYLFAVNATWDNNSSGGKNALKGVTAKISLPGDRTVYDAVNGGSFAELSPQGGKLAGEFRFGPGQMRVFARPARPIGGVQTATPVVTNDYTNTAAPQRLEISALLVDKDKRVLSGSAPMQIVVTDPLGQVRYDLNRATDQGCLKLSLPLAVNDPSGAWQVTVRDLLAGTEDSVAFNYQAPPWCGALAGAVPRAIYFCGTGSQPQFNDRENIFRFFRLHKDVTIVTGDSSYSQAAAQRLTDILKPWGIRCKTIAAAEANQMRPISPEEAPTWTAMGFGVAGKAGFNVSGATILLGNPQDNPLLDFAAKAAFLAYPPARDVLPGRGRGMMAWMTDAVQYGEEAIALIAYDAAGMAEAVGTMYEAAAGMDGLEALVQPGAAALTPAAKAMPKAPLASAAWTSRVPDAVVALAALPSGRTAALGRDGTLSLLDAAGKPVWTKTIVGGDTWRLAASPDGKVIAVGASHHLVAFDDSGKQLCDVAFEFPLLTAQGRKVMFRVIAVAVAADGRIAVCCEARLDAKLLLLSSTGQVLWTVGGTTPEAYAQWEADNKVFEAGAAARKLAQDAIKAAQARQKADMEVWNKADPTTRGPKPAGPPKGEKPPTRPVYPAGESLYSLNFVVDGKRILAVAAKRAHVLDAASGKPTCEPIPDIAGRFAPMPWGENFLATDGVDKVLLISPAEGKVLAQTPLPNGAGVTAVAAVGSSVAVVAEGERALWLLKSLEGPAEDQTSWRQQTLERVPRLLAVDKDRLAVSYWGGHVRIMDVTGKVLTQRSFPDEVLAMAWQDGKLVVGLAGGTVEALAVPAKGS